MAVQIHKSRNLGFFWHCERGQSLACFCCFLSVEGIITARLMYNHGFNEMSRHSIVVSLVRCKTKVPSRVENPTLRHDGMKPSQSQDPYLLLIRQQINQQHEAASSECQATMARCNNNRSPRTDSTVVNARSSRANFFHSRPGQSWLQQGQMPSHQDS